VTAFAQKLLRWSRAHARPLPWRGARDPYRIWISEIMLQQTRVETAAPYFLRFIRRFPTLRRLARARLESVLREWEGLGYYSRARNLHRAAGMLASRRTLPREYEAWCNLPGVGRYTAAAVVSLAWDDPAVALDANVRRILARYHGYRPSVRGSSAEIALERFFRGDRAAAKPGAFLQALMDLGQQVCLPRSPDCPACPAASECVARIRGWQERLPARAARPSVPFADVTAAVIRQGDRVLLAKRPPGKVLAGLWEFPGGKRERGETLEACLRRELREELAVRVCVGRKIATVDHAFSHLRIRLHAYQAAIAGGVPRPVGAAAVRWVRIFDLRKYPMGRADRRIADRIRRSE
jgi:A/G-specific adenine glycosylase